MYLLERVSQIVTFEHAVHPSPHVNSSPVCLLTTVEEDGDAEALEKTADKSSSSAWAESKDTWPFMCVPKDIVKKHPLSHLATKHVTLSLLSDTLFPTNRDGWWTMRWACMRIWMKGAQEWEGNTVFSKLQSSYVQWGGHCLVNSRPARPTRI